MPAAAPRTAAMDAHSGFGPPPALSLAFEDVSYAVPIDKKRARQDERERRRKEIERAGTAAAAAPESFWTRARKWFADCRPSCGRDKEVRMMEVLHGVSGLFQAGHLAAIMGPSGSGKSSLLDVLAGRNKVGAVAGKLYLAGVEYPSITPGVLQSLLGYVMQDDAFVANLTVRETLLFSLRMRVRRDQLTKELEESIVSSLLSLLNLSSVANTQVGSPMKRGISGGERRRLSIGCELVTRPPVVFLDEPTSGLDAANALRVVKLLRTLASRGHTIIASIHQPRSSIFRMFDELLIMHRGSEAYFGPGGAVCVEKLQGYTGKECEKWENPGDWVVDLLEGGADDEDGDGQAAGMPGQANGGTPPAPNQDDIVLFLPEGSEPAIPLPPPPRGSTPTLPDVYRASDEYALLRKSVASHASNPTVLPAAVPRPTFGTLLRLMTERTMLQTLRDPGIIYIRTGAALGIALLVGLIFFQQPQDSQGQRVNGLLFLMNVFALFCLPAISQQISDRLLFQRERASGIVNTPAYFLSGMAVEVPLLIVVAVLYGTISYWMVGFYPAASNFFIYLLIITLVILVGFSATQVASSVSSSVPVGIAIYMIILVYSLLLGGFMISKDDLPAGAQWVVYTSYYWFGFSGLMVNEFQDRPYGPALLARQGMAGITVWSQIGCLVAFMVGFRLLAFVLLSTLHKEKR
ncbi:P-loop containing nucleoside triphosphate hydrolase protein [Hyaloraphidium curvatum]|nr:P-loop containing nucleoside triphosphate hydrolase protein [Hyaloraphidium curvatum]